MNGDKIKIIRDSGQKKVNVSGKVDPSIKKALGERVRADPDKKESRLVEIALFEYLTR